jgi:predicted ArsR family transcriptional regulator
MQSTRSRIIHFLKSNSAASAGDLARTLDMTTANIRYHLEILLEEGHLQITGQRQAGGAGRPIYLYTLSSAFLGENLTALSGALLAALAEGDQPIYRVAAEKLANSGIPEQTNRISRYNLAVERLNTMNYHASWQARPDGPQVELRHCPYRDLALTHPQICLIDQELVSRLFDIPMEMIQKRDFGQNPYSPCIFSSQKN